MTDDIPGTLLHFQINLSNVFTQYADAHQLYTAGKADDTGHAGPTGHGHAPEGLDKGPDDAYEADEGHHQTHDCDHPQGLDTETGDAVDGQIDHFGEGIVALAGQTLLAVIVNGSGFKTDALSGGNP